MGDKQLDNEFDAGQSLGEALLSRYLDEPEDTGILAALTRWLDQHPEARDAYELLMDPVRRGKELATSKRLGEYMHHDYNRLLTRIEEAPIVASIPGRRKSMIYILTGLAASLLIAVCTLLLVKHTSSNQTPLEAASAAQDIAPGGNKAILTLSNGRTITLDSASNGLLAQQGKVDILKSAQGQVDYQAGKSPSSEIIYNTMTTPRGGTFTLTLADGTKVWLNAASSLRYPVSFAGSKLREVTLTGEGYFEIAPNKSVPFTVTTDNTTIKVLGTSFDVMAYDNEKQLQTTLLDGAVAVNQGNNTKVLRPGQQARISVVGVNTNNMSTNNKEDGISIVNVDPKDYVSWKNGLIQMHDADIPTVMRQISRWYNVKVDYQGNHIPSIELEGRVARTLTLSQVLKVLNLNGIHCKIEGRTITVLQ